MKYNKIAGALLCFNRPSYTKQVVESLENAVESNEIDWYVFQDGLENQISGNIYGTKKEINKVAKVINNSTLPIKEFIQNEYNVSIAQQKQKAHQLFNDYDLVYFFEDDLVLGKHYLRLLRIAAEQLPDHICSMFSHPGRNDKRLRVLTKCQVARVWGYYMNKRVYDKIKDEYDRFYREISNVDYNIKWQTPNVRKLVKFPWKCHDITITRLCKKNGANKYNPIVTRGRNIGKEGAIAYRSEKKWFRKQFHKQPQKITYKQDASIKDFKVQ